MQLFSLHVFINRRVFSGRLTDPAIKRKLDNADDGKGASSLPPIGGFSINPYRLSLELPGASTYPKKIEYKND